MQSSSTLYQEHLNEWLTRHHGLPSHQIHDLLFCNRKLWLATPNGLAIFDGENITVLDQRQGLLTHGLRSLAVDGEYILASSDMGIDRISNHDFKVIDQYSSVDDGLGWSQAAVAIEPNKYLLACSKGLRIWDVEQSKLIKTNSDLDDEFIVNLVGFEHQTALIHANSSGLWLYSNNTVLPFLNDTLMPFGSVKKIIKDQHSVWLVAEEYLLQLDSDFNLIASIQIPETLHNIRTVRLNENSDLYVASDQRFVLLSKTAKIWQIKQTMHHDVLLNAFTSDQFNNLWAASDFSGLLKVSPLHKYIKSYRTKRKNSILSIQSADSYSKRLSTSDIMPSPNQGILVGGTSLSYFVPIAKPETSEEIIGLRNSICWDLQNFDNIGIWAATDKGLVHIESFSQLTPIHYTDQKLGGGRCLAEFNGDIIYGSVSGLFHFTISTGQFSTIADKDNHSLGYIYAIEQFDVNQFFLCTLGRGVWTYNASTKSLQQAFKGIEKDNIYAIDLNAAGQAVIAADNQIWLAGESQCELIYEVADSVVAWSCKWFAQDKVLLGTSSGLKVLCLLEKKIDFILDVFPRERFWEFTTSRSLFAGPDIGYWCGLNEGLQHIDVDTLQHLVPLPIPEVKQITCNKNFQRLSDRVTLKEGNWTLQIQIGCFWLWHEDSLKYEYRISRLQKKWIPLDGNTMSFTTLPVGKYIVEVKVLNSLTQSTDAHPLLMIEVIADSWLSKKLRLTSKKLKNVTEQVFQQRRFSKLQHKYLQMEKLIEHRTNELEASNKKLLDLNKSLEVLSNRDQLTGLYNRRYFLEEFSKEIKRSLRDKTPVSILMIDVDYFKKYNDHYGHLAGDHCLKSIAKVLESSFHRSSDLVARYGGEEFIAVMHNSTEQSSIDMAIQIVKEISQLKIEHQLSECSEYATISVGVTTDLPMYEHGKTTSIQFQEKIINEADKALYIAKAQGRNQAYKFKGAKDTN